MCERERVCVCFRGCRCERVEGALSLEYFAFLVAILFQCLCVREREREGGREGGREKEREGERKSVGDSDRVRERVCVCVFVCLGVRESKARSPSNILPSLSPSCARGVRVWGVRAYGSGIRVSSLGYRIQD